MPKKVKTRRQRKAAYVKKSVANGELTNQQGKKSSNLESRVNIDENLAKHMNRPPVVSSSQKEELTSDKFVQNKAVWKLGNAGKYEKQNSSSDTLGAIDDDELLDQIWKDLDDIFPSSDKAVADDTMSPNVEWEKESDNLRSSNKLVKKKAAHSCGETSKGKGCDVLDTEKKQQSSSNLASNFNQAKFDQILKDLGEIFPPSDEAVAKGGISPTEEWQNQCGKLKNRIKNRNLAKNRPLIVSPLEQGKQITHQRDGTPARNAWKMGNALDKYEEQNSNSGFFSIIEEAEFDSIWTDLHKIFSPSEKIANSGLASKVEKEELSGKLEASDIVDSNLAKHRHPLVSPSEKYTDKTITYCQKKVKKKATHQRSGIPKGIRVTSELDNALDKDEAQSSSDLFGIIDKSEWDRIWQDLDDVFLPRDEAVPNAVISPTSDGDSGPVPPKFFGNSGYFMLTGTNSQLQHQLKDLEARNIFVDSFVELSDTMADIVEQQMTDLVQSRTPILGVMRDKYDLLEPRRVPHQKKQRKKTNK